MRPLFHVALPVILVASAGWAPQAQARFTCSTNQDCWETAQQCDPGRIPCNDGICDPSSSKADAIGCVLIPNDDKCDDGNFCNGVQTCSRDHGCNDPVIPDCDDGVACTVDVCNETLNKCTNTKRHTRCSNGLYCDGREICDANLGCIAGTPPKCGDGIACTVDTCDEANDTCKNTPTNSKCSNGLFCDGVETCSPTGGCQPGTPPNCNDNVACTADSCNETTNACDHVVNNAICNNGQFCDGTEFCSPTLGCRPGTPPNCNDNITCTLDSCDESKDICAHVANNAICNNGQFCDGTEFCSPTLGCRPGTAPVCSDNIACTIDRCVEATDSCEHTVRHDRCDNDKYCDGVEICSPTLGCRAGTPPNCSDNIACTIDKCVEATDSCSHTESNALCSNGLYCDGVERCDFLLGCYAGIPPSCSDNVDCTVDVCIEETDSCTHTASNARCSNGKFCDGTEICDPLLGCKNGPVPECADTVPCTVDTCSETAQACLNTPSHIACSNQLFCDGNEICDPLFGCQPSTAPNCADNLICTTDICAESLDSCVHAPNGALCGNGIIDVICGEECEGPNREICNNLQDDDGDMLVDCQDPDCVQPVETCDDLCRIVPPCLPLRNDPAVISWGTDTDRATDRPGAFSFHARLHPSTPIDPLTERFIVTLSNEQGEIFRAELAPANIRSKGNRYRYRAVDRDAVEREGGIAKLSIQRRLYGGEIGYGFRVTAYGDFSRATLPLMTTQAYFGDDVGYVTATWSGQPGRWILRQKDYDDGVP